jgi:hypothetical protein
VLFRSGDTGRVNTFRIQAHLDPVPVYAGGRGRAPLDELHDR